MPLNPSRLLSSWKQERSNVCGGEYYGRYVAGRYSWPVARIIDECDMD